MAQTAGSIDVGISLQSSEFQQRMGKVLQQIDTFDKDTKQLAQTAQAAYKTVDDAVLRVVQAQQQRANIQLQLASLDAKDVENKKRLKQELADVNRELKIGNAERSKAILNARIVENQLRANTLGSTPGKSGVGGPGGAGGNVGLQVQDIATQLSSGTSLAQTLGQQLPQLLSGFGGVGILVGTLAAIGIPAAAAAMKALNVDFRDFNEIADKLEPLLNKINASQIELATSASDLKYKYGESSEAVRELLELEGRLAKNTYLAEKQKAVEALGKKYSDLTGYIRETTLFDAFGKPLIDARALSRNLEDLSKKYDLTNEQAKAYAETLERIANGGDPTKALKQLNEFLAKNPLSDKAGANVKTQELNADLAGVAERERKERERADAAKAKQTAETIAGIKQQIARNGLETEFDERIATAKREGETVVAIQLEADKQIALKRQEYAALTKKDGIDRTALLSSDIKKIRADEADQVAAYNKKTNTKIAEDNLNSLRIYLEEEQKLRTEAALKVGQANIASRGSRIEAENQTKRLDFEKKLIGLTEAQRTQQLALFDFEELRRQREREGVSEGNINAEIEAKQALLNKQIELNEATLQYNQVLGSINGAIDNFVNTGKLSFKSLADSIIKDLIRIELKKSAALLLSSLGGPAGIAASIFGGFKADGGPVSSGTPYVVGERGPELFVPGSSGSIVPNGAMGGGQTVINISAVDAGSVQRLFKENSASIYQANKFAERYVPSKPGRA